MNSGKENILRELEGRLRLKVASEATAMPEDPADKGTVAIPQPTAEEKKQTKSLSFVINSAVQIKRHLLW